MNIFRLHIAACVASVLVLVSCSQREETEPKSVDELESAPIAVSFSLGEGGTLAEITPTEGPAQGATPETRASGNSTPLDPGETVRVTIYKKGAAMTAAGFVAEKCYVVEANAVLGGANVLKPCTVNDQGVISGMADELFLVPELEYDMYVYSPAKAILDNKTVNNIAHGEDFLASKTTIKLKKFTESIPITNLEHKSSMVELRVIADPTDPGVRTLVGQSVTLKNVAKAPASYTLSSPSLSISPGVENVIIEAFERVSDVEFTASKIVLPKAVAGNFDMEFKVLINGSQYTLNASVSNFAFEANKRYIWTVTCQREGVNMQFSVLNWTSETINSLAGVPAPLQEPSNTYMVKPGLGVSFEMKYPDGTAIANAASIAKAELLWQTKDGANLVVGSNQNVVWNQAKNQIRVYSNVMATSGGRALVVARNAADEIVHSWLIWVTSYDPSKALNAVNKTPNASISNKVEGGSVHVYDAVGFLGTNGVQAVMMDRNLGATSNTTPGCLFQNGRKDPFLQDLLFAADGTPYIQTASGGAATEDMATKNPSVIYTQYSGSQWTPFDVATTTGRKSNNDPCPRWWRVPFSSATNGTWANFTTSTFTNSGSNRVYQAGVYAYYPMAGYYDPTTGLFVASQGRYWGAGRNGANGFCLNFSNSVVQAASAEPLSTAMSIRCVQDVIEFPFGIPTLGQITVSNLTHNAALLKGTMTSDAGAVIAEYGFFYSTDQAAANGSGVKVIAGDMVPSTGVFTGSATPLVQGTTYYAQAYAQTNGGNIAYTSPRVPFTPLGPPTVVTVDARATSHSAATVTGRVNNTGGTAIERGIIYSTIQGFDPLSQGTKIKDVGTTTGVYTIDITGLASGTVYYTRAYVVNELTIAYGMQRNFETFGPPVLSVAAVSNITNSSAKYKCALLGPNPPRVTSWGFEYSTSPSFPAGSGTKVINAPAPYVLGEFFGEVTDLAEGVTYFMRAFAVNEAGKIYSPDIKYTTPNRAKVRTLTVEGSSRINRNCRVTGVFTGILDDLGSTELLDRGFEWSLSPDFTGTINTISLSKGAVGSFAHANDFMESDITYYVRAYAMSLAGISYGEIKQTRLNYIAPNFDGVTVETTGRGLGTIRIVTNKLGVPGNAEMYDQGLIFEAINPGGHGPHTVYTEVSVGDYFDALESSKLMIDTEYKVSQYIRDCKGVHTSAAFVKNHTLCNYAASYDGDVVIGYTTIDQKEAWSGGLASLAFIHISGDDGAFMTSELVDRHTEKHLWFPAAERCHNSHQNGGDRSRWFLGSRREYNTVIPNINAKPYNELCDFGDAAKDNRYWTSEEYSPGGAWAVNGQKGTDTEGKNDQHKVRCLRKRVLPADYFPPKGDERKPLGTGGN